MNETAPQNERVIEARISELRALLDRGAEDLRAKDASLAERAAERQRFALLGDACVALEGLRALGDSRAFWEGVVDASTGDAHVGNVRERVRSFEDEILAAEQERARVAAEIAQLEEDLWLLEDYLLELREREEQRKLDWVIEREASAPAARETIMPWSRHREEAARLQRALAVALSASLLVGLLLPWVDLPIPELEPVEIPDRLTRLIAEARPVSVAFERPQVPTPPEPREPVTEPVETVPVAAETETVTEESRPAKGLLAFRENLSPRAQPAVSGRLGSQARISRAGETAVGRSRRALVSSEAAQSSGGIDVGSLSRSVGTGGGGSELTGVDIARAQSAIGGGGTSDRPVAGGGPPAGRTDEEIQIVFDRHKAALYRLYNRQLREDPSLRGQMLLRLIIQPDGSVSLCELRATDMAAPDLSAQVVARVKTFDFGAKEVPAVTILYPIDFLPAT